MNAEELLKKDLMWMLLDGFGHAFDGASAFLLCQGPHVFGDGRYYDQCAFFFRTV